MTEQIKARNNGIIIVTLVLAMILMLMPLPDMIRLVRPEWVLMTLIYWAMTLPHRVGIGTAWFTGLLMDVMMGAAMGVLAFSYAFSIYLVARFHLQLRLYPLWQQAVIILTITFFVQFVFVLFSGAEIDWRICFQAISSTVIWPVVHVVLHSVRYTFHVS